MLYFRKYLYHAVVISKVKSLDVGFTLKSSYDRILTFFSPVCKYLTSEINEIHIDNSCEMQTERLNSSRLEHVEVNYETTLALFILQEAQSYSLTLEYRKSS